MNNIGIVTSREYLTRVKKKSFILMTLLTPLLIASFYGIIIWVNIGQSGSVEQQNIVLVDPSGVFSERIVSPDNIRFIPQKSYSIEDLIYADSIDAVITVAQNYTIDKPLTLNYKSMGSLSVNSNASIKDAFGTVIRDQKLSTMGIEQGAIDSLRSSVEISQVKVDENGDTKTSNAMINSGVGMILSMMIYFFIFLYGVQVMKGVIEEKTNRIVELIVSTVKPFQLMMGKVIGIALVGLTQLTIWIVLSGILMAIIGVIVGINFMDINELKNAAQNPDLSGMKLEDLELLTALQSLPYAKLFLSFLFYFVGGYLFYGALFAAIGSAVDNETDTQQFMLPITLPLLFTYIMSFSFIINNPDSSLSFWLSIIPFTSPIAMMVRLPFGVPDWQLALSMVLLIGGFILTTWIAAKIYRVGILMYGKKASYKELAKWLFYKE
jgi:ABC-2 type transport system permease protein